MRIPSTHSLAARALQGLIGLWLLIEGSHIATLPGLLMMMVGIVVVVTAASNVADSRHRREHRSEGSVQATPRRRRL
jgi:hypothetical protein